MMGFFYRFPKLMAWIERLSQLPYYKENETGAKELIQIVDGMLQKNRGKAQAK
jgi:hypothetical protein